ncbi:Sodium/pantothenate symporter [Rubripirellula lacrimiformis]|uniref:Sodium/pantothenate symporter n=1 Tax=Rubripirellula lacrimiformis TaxID=1930273 RepID=A0A517NEW3_9BACT|nr:sodium:solute symporter family protein [Rubripirellula lacrimiformis]QDT05667.1 Sodium/pantothenate symporter [Rubripirellula lacrimiformis]
MSPKLFLTCFAIYVLAMIFVGWWVTRKQSKGDEFLLGGRRVPFFLTLGTTIATMVGTGSSMGAVGKGYQAGWMGMLFGIGGAIGILLLAWIFAPVRQYRFMTMAEELSSYVGADRIVSNLVAVFTFLACVGWLGAHIVGGGYYLQFVTGIDPSLAKVMIAMGFAAYSVIGGYLAVVWTDTIQAVVLFIGFVGTAIFSFQYVGGFSGLEQVNATLAAASQTTHLHAASLILAIAIGVLGTPAFRQRIYSGSSSTGIRKAFVWSGVLYLCFAILPAIIGMAAYKGMPDLAGSDLAFPSMALSMLPLWLGIITLLAGLSASMSSASSDAFAGVTTVIRDLYPIAFGRMPPENRSVLYSRIALILTTCIALGLALSADTILDYIKDMIALFVTGMAVTGLLGRLWNRYNAWGAIASLTGAFGTALYFKFDAALSAYWGGSVIPAVVVSVTLGIATALLTPQDRLSHDQALALLQSQRESSSC